MQKSEFYQEQEKYNQKIDLLKESYFHKDINAVTEYCEMVLNNSEYPDAFPKNFEIEYNPDNQILIVEYQLPNQEAFPTIKEVKERDGSQSRYRLWQDDRKEDSERPCTINGGRIFQFPGDTDKELPQ